MTEHTQHVLLEVLGERTRQDAKWGPQDHPSFDTVLMQHGVDHLRLAEEYEMPTESRGKFLCETAFKRGEGTFAHIALEEFCEIIGAAGDVAHVREELIQLAAVCVAWVESIDRTTNAELSNVP